MTKPEVFQLDLPASARPSLRRRIDAHAKIAEDEALSPLLAAATLPAAQHSEIQDAARAYVQAMKRTAKKRSATDKMMDTFSLSSPEGLALMSLSEALLRIPDAATREALLHDKFSGVSFASAPIDGGFSARLNTLALKTAAAVTRLSHRQNPLSKALKVVSAPVLSRAVTQKIRALGDHFVYAETINAAVKAATPDALCSFDMLGEGARTHADAARYAEAYRRAIAAVGATATSDDPRRNHGISIKISALHPRYESTHQAHVFDEIFDTLLSLCRAAAKQRISVCLDAEECRRLDISLDLFEKLYRHPDLQNSVGLGLAVQAYQKRAFYVIDWLAALARSSDTPRPIFLRLVKGAYWDSEIKAAQVAGVEGFPVFTRKENTDVSYLACARKILDAGADVFFPQFATHNAYTVAWIESVAANRPFEFQRLHHMDQGLYTHVTRAPVRTYAPVGAHRDLLGYLVRRLLENGANQSFLHQIRARHDDHNSILAHPVDKARQNTTAAHDRVPLPAQIFSPRQNSTGRDLSDPLHLDALKNGAIRLPVLPAPTSAKDLSQRVERAHAAFGGWNATTVDTRAGILRKAADALEKRYTDFVLWTMADGKKTLGDAIAEVREAIDFLRYYADEAMRIFAIQNLPGPTGERNTLTLEGRGVFACISPWNFPLAIFTGQVAAALVCGNTVIAKPAEQTTRLALEMIRVLHDAGVPKDALHGLVGSGRTLGQTLVEHPLIAGVAFTGSTAVAKSIQRTLAAKDGAIVPLIAETGGLNAMIADSSALIEPLVDDVVRSAFHSAGQRCSALRVLYVQDEIYAPFVTMLCGAMDTLRVGMPQHLDTDVGPVIDAAAQASLMRHIAAHKKRVRHQTPVDKSVQAHDTFVPPTLIELSSLEQLDGEKFGPILHLIRYRRKDLPRVVEAINATGYGLTFGVHSRLDTLHRHLSATIHAGNIYINRSMIGAVVGAQPFGGQGLSGTGPKAGGHHYLYRFVSEKAISVDTTAAGGNASLMTL